jgi:hypothetical protein
MKSIFCTFLFLCCTFFLLGQKYVQVETQNRYKVKRFTIGETLTFKLKGKEEVWRTQEITDILPEQNIILMDNQIVELEKIACFRRNRSFIQGTARQLYKFAAGWLLYSTVDHIVTKTPFTKKDLNVPTVSTATGFVLQNTFKYKYTRFGNRKRLRLIDLNFK